MSPIHRCRTRSMAFANPSRCVTRQATTNATKGLRMAYTDAVGIRVRNSNVLRARKSGQGSACGRCQKITTDACPHATLSTSCQYRCFEEFRPADGGAIPMSGSKKITSTVRRAANARLKYASRGTATVGRVSEKNVAPGSSASEAASNSCMARWSLCTRFCRKSKSSGSIKGPVLVGLGEVIGTPALAAVVGGGLHPANAHVEFCLTNTPEQAVFAIIVDVAEVLVLHRLPRSVSGLLGARRRAPPTASLR